MTSTREMLGLQVPGDEKVPVTVRDWDAMKRALWRSRVSWEIAVREAIEIVARCRHEKDCPGAEEETEPCFSGCPDREKRMSALVILNAARAFSPANARRPADAPYYAPTREYYSDIIGLLRASEAECEALHKTISEMNGTAPTPEPNVILALPKREQDEWSSEEFAEAVAVEADSEDSEEDPGELTSLILAQEDSVWWRRLWRRLRNLFS